MSDGFSSVLVASDHLMLREKYRTSSGRRYFCWLLGAPVNAVAGNMPRFFPSPVVLGSLFSGAAVVQYDASGSGSSKGGENQVPAAALQRDRSSP